MNSELRHLLDPVTLSIFIVVLCLSWYLFSNSKRNIPPGPRCWPLVGCIPYMIRANKPFNELLMDLNRQYGDIVRLKIGKESLVFIFRSKLLRKALIEQDDKFKFRPNHLYTFKRAFNEKGIVFGNGVTQAALRKFSIVALKDFGVGKKSLEERIYEEAEKLSEFVRATNGEPTCFNATFDKVAANVLSNVIYGSRFEYDDASFTEYLSKIDRMFKNMSFFMPENYLPFLVYFPGSKLRKLLKLMEELKQYVSSQIEKHRETFDPDNIRDFVDLYLQSEASDNKRFNEEEIYLAIFEIFNAGTDATSAVFMWGILYLTLTPAAQEKCRAEILKVVGKERKIGMQDRKHLPYLDATVSECLRIAGAIMQAVRTVSEDTRFEGYDLPKNSFILMHWYSALKDPDAWESPEEFRPERFFDENGKCDMTKESFIPEGLGSRDCMGKYLARIELFLILGTLIQRFRFELPDGCVTLDTSNSDSTINKPRPNKICARMV